MNRQEFTLKIAQLIFIMAKDNFPIIDYVMRSKYEQKRLYDLGNSACDGTNKISRHQLGLAMDIYFLDDNGQIDFNYASQRAKDCCKKYHDIWVTMGGKPLVVFTDKDGNKVTDMPHYEG